MHARAMDNLRYIRGVMESAGDLHRGVRLGAGRHRASPRSSPRSLPRARPLPWAGSRRGSPRQESPPGISVASMTLKSHAGERAAVSGPIRKLVLSFSPRDDRSARC